MVCCDPEAPGLGTRVFRARWPRRGAQQSGEDQGGRSRRQAAIPGFVLMQESDRLPSGDIQGELLKGWREKSDQSRLAERMLCTEIPRGLERRHRSCRRSKSGQQDDTCGGPGPGRLCGQRLGAGCRGREWREGAQEGEAQPVRAAPFGPGQPAKATAAAKWKASKLYWCLSSWLTSLCIMGSSFIHLSRTDSSVFFLMAE